MHLWKVPVSTVTCHGRSCMRRSHRSTLKLQSICYIFVVLPGVQRSYIWPARTWTWSTAQPWILVKLSQDHMCVPCDFYIHAYGLLHNGVHTWDYLLERWQCLYIGTRMEFSISFSDLIHSSIQYSIQRCVCKCLEWLHAHEGIQGWQVTLQTPHTLVICPCIFSLRVLSKQITHAWHPYSHSACAVVCSEAMQCTR